MVARGFKICLLVSSLFFIIVAIVIVTLILTMFKPKNPDIFINPVDLENFQLLTPNSTTAPLDMVVTIVNPNYGSFKQVNSGAHLKYRDTIIAEVPLEARLFPARTTTNVSTSADITTEKLIADPNFWSDVEGGVFNLTAEAVLDGKVTMIKIFKLKAKIYIHCGISFNITAVDASSSCISKIKL
ncbi:hypothetical protein VNO78_05968 [Psophocarpus tetragonolobus]|uniref:Late embryogenesis abundant protein LEA-2 subgroup domain-containing protein n=1 Tax=Psophocarpus tetragonolobus TaxID=3891 RepID=A0AAN9XQT4_PSOTE